MPPGTGRKRLADDSRCGRVHAHSMRSLFVCEYVSRGGRSYLSAAERVTLAVSRDIDFGFYEPRHSSTSSGLSAPVPSPNQSYMQSHSCPAWICMQREENKDQDGDFKYPAGDLPNFGAGV